MLALSTITIGTLVVITLAFPAYSQDKKPDRTPWQKTGTTSGETVRWIVEGCAAYPVTVDAEPDAPVVAEGFETKPDMAARATKLSMPR